MTPRRPFDFSANHIVLDFINTVNGRPVYTRDDLRGPADLVDWAAAAGVVENPAEIIGAGLDGSSRFASAIVLRESLYRVFGPIASGDEPQRAAVEVVGRRATQGMRSAHWVRGSAGYEPRFALDSIEVLCDLLADRGMQLLRSAATDRLGCCAGCGWLFLDTSRGHGRRWCSMNACGVRDKMRRYHQRQTLVSNSP